jgi:hypothetical protein
VILLALREVRDIEPWIKTKTNGNRTGSFQMTGLTRHTILAAAPGTLAAATLPARAAKKYGPGVTDIEIKNPRSASALRKLSCALFPEQLL